MADDGGLARFQKRMRAIPEAVRLGVQPALLASAEEMQGMMKHLAPEDSGDLKDSIAVTTAGHSTPPYSQPGGSMVVPENAVAITVGNHAVRYAHLPEYGTAKAAAQPYFWPSFRLLKKRATNRIKRAISKAVKQNWGK
jgi:HK97 gp10 family phage protein